MKLTLVWLTLAHSLHVDDCPDSQALLDIYQAGGGPWSGYNWHQTNDCCQWTGIGCDTNLRVTSLQLPCIKGSLSASVGALSELQVLAMYSNCSSALNTPLPTTMEKLVNLQSLQITNVGFTGSLSFLDQYKSLQHIDANGNRFTGELPSFSQLTDLTFVYLAMNQLTGRVPDMSNLRHLRFLNMSGNSLNGPLQFPTNRPLEDIDLSHNQISGSIPDVIGQAPWLSSLILSSNQFTGTIPCSVFAIVNVGVLDFSQNKLSHIPISCPTPKLLWNCDLSRNPFQCPVPAWSVSICRANCST
jgi:Leucine-rich repeat (LRR) protein